MDPVVKFAVQLYVLVCLSVQLISTLPVPCHSRDGGACGQSEVTSLPGHWPSSYCKVTNIMFDSGSQAIRINGDLTDLDKCFKAQDLWQFDVVPHYQELNDIVCDQVFAQGHFFTTYYFHGSNYFHLHYDTLIPLFSALQEQLSKGSLSFKEIALLPAVEATRGQGIEWNTDAFLDSESYWMQMLMVMSKKHRLLPLDRRLTGMNKTICFKEAFFGTPKVNHASPSLLSSYATFVKKALGIKPPVPEKNKKPKVGLIHREGRRRILNEDQLIKAVESLADVEAVDFSKLSVKEQIQKIQDYSVLMGVNGAGLANALYLPESSVAVQLVPYKAELNTVEFGNLLKARGPYLEWHNNHPELNHSAPGDPFRNGSDTVVDVSEFTELVNKALKLHRGSLHS